VDDPSTNGSTGNGPARMHEIAVHHGLDGAGGVRLYTVPQDDNQRGLHVVVVVSTADEVALLPGVSRPRAQHHGQSIWA
jgi:hypothetical protein